MSTIPQFGEPKPGHAYPDRPAAFGIAPRGDLIALAQVAIPGRPLQYDLPGGGIDPGETPQQAAVREFGEETGLVVTAADILVRADQFFVNDDGQAFNVRGAFMTVTIGGEDPGLKIEADHSLVWRTPLEAIRLVRREAHAWAVAVWLRTLRD
jgi:8-oxo-dGTP diphosphatase